MAKKIFNKNPKNDEIRLNSDFGIEDNSEDHPRIKKNGNIRPNVDIGICREYSKLQN